MSNPEWKYEFVRLIFETYRGWAILPDNESHVSHKLQVIISGSVCGLSIYFSISRCLVPGDPQMVPKSLPCGQRITSLQRLRRVLFVCSPWCAIGPNHAWIYAFVWHVGDSRQHKHEICARLHGTNNNSLPQCTYYRGVPQEITKYCGFAVVLWNGLSCWHPTAQYTWARDKT